jgi:membrane associated rhomboid family serine protease
MGAMNVSRFEETSLPPRRQPAPRHEPEPDFRPAREPVFNAPWPALLLVALIVGSYALQSRFPDEFVLYPLAFSSTALAEGRWWTLFTSLFLHGGWAHALMNGAFALAFGTPLARFLGDDARGAIVFFGFYLACGVLSTLGFWALHSSSPALLVGASGAVSGLMGAAARLMAGQGWRLGPIFSRPVLGMGAAWIVVNLVIGLLAQGLMPGAGDSVVAWEAHIAGFIAGVLIVGPFVRLVLR